MTSEEEVLIEQYFPFFNMDEKNRTFYLNLLLNSKDLTDSEYNFKKSSPSNYDLVFMSFKNEGSVVKFDGAISNGEENKLMYGAIIKKGEKFYVFSNVYRLFELIFGDDKEYVVVDEFTFKDDKVFRRSAYNGKKGIKKEIKLKTPEEMTEYYQRKIGKTRNR